MSRSYGAAGKRHSPSRLRTPRRPRTVPKDDRPSDVRQQPRKHRDITQWVRQKQEQQSEEHTNAQVELERLRKQLEVSRGETIVAVVAHRVAERDTDLL